MLNANKLGTRTIFLSYLLNINEKRNIIFDK